MSKTNAKAKTDTKKEPLVVVAAFGYNKPNPKYKNSKQLKGGEQFTGKFLHTFAYETSYGQAFNYLIETSKGKITIFGCAYLNKIMKNYKRDDLISLRYDGEGEAKGTNNPPRLWTDLTEDGAAEASEESAESSEDSESSPW